MEDETKDLKWLTERCKWADNVTYLGAVQDTLTALMNEGTDLGLKVQMNSLLGAIRGNIKYLQDEADTVFTPKSKQILEEEQ